MKEPHKHHKQTKAVYTSGPLYLTIESECYCCKGYYIGHRIQYIPKVIYVSSKSVPTISSLECC